MIPASILGLLSRQGDYQWLKDPVCQRDWDDAHHIDNLYDLHADDATLGYRFLTDELDLEHGITIGENRVHRLCRIAGIHASHHKKRSKPGATGPAPHDDLLAVVDEHGVVRHEFIADVPKVWLWDISEHPTREGKLYICAIKDVFSNKIVGYSIDSRMKSSLVRAAMRNEPIPNWGPPRHALRHPATGQPAVDLDLPHAGSTVLTMTQFFSPLGRS